MEVEAIKKGLKMCPSISINNIINTLELHLPAHLHFSFPSSPHLSLAAWIKLFWFLQILLELQGVSTIDPQRLVKGNMSISLVNHWCRTAPLWDSLKD